MVVQKVLVDTDVVLNVLLHEMPLMEASAQVFVQMEFGDIRGYVTATTITNIYYIACKRRGRNLALECIIQLLNTKGLDILPVDRNILTRAAEAGMSDFEDAVQAMVAHHHDVDYIVTQNLKDYKNAKVPALSPAQFLEKIN